MNLFEQMTRIYKGADEDMQARIRRAVAAVEENAACNYLAAHFLYTDEGVLGGFTLPGQDIRRHLAGCKEVYSVVCTLGAGIDRLLDKLKITDLSAAYLVDVAASLYVEQLAENSWAELCEKARRQGLSATTRYSCGYGDFDLSAQKQLLKLSGADVRFFIKVNEGGMMYPTKSITYLCGFKEKGYDL